MIKPYEHNEELCKDFIQGWYMPDDSTSEILKEIKKLYKNKIGVFNGSPQNYFFTGFEMYPPSVQEKYLTYLNDIILMYGKNYESVSKLQYKLCKVINVQYWKPGNFYGEYHFEQTCTSDSIYRNLVFMTYLNDVNEGGETDFLYQGIQIKPKKGLTIVWPAFWTHTHKGCKTEHDKYVITGWFELIPSRSDLYYDLPKKSNHNYC